MKVLEQYSQAKHSATPSEDQVALTATVAAVIDGATPKSDFRFADGETPGHFAARRLREAIEAGITDPQKLSLQLLTPETAFLPFQSRPTASIVYYDETQQCVTQIGDAPFAFVMDDGEVIEYRNEKVIDHVLSDWRAMILHSLLDRGIITPQQIIQSVSADKINPTGPTDKNSNADPARRIIQPFITRQVIYQNTVGQRYSFGVMDGQPIPEEHIHRYSIPAHCHKIILASDGFPRLFPTLAQSLAHLQQALDQDPLCIDALRGTKGLRPGATWPDDITYLCISLH